MKLIRRIIAFPFILLVRIYQWIISPIFPANCRYQPTCSTYMIEAIEEWGVIRGLLLGIKRIASCHPWGGHGHDPVPKRGERKSDRNHKTQ